MGAGLATKAAQNLPGRYHYRKTFSLDSILVSKAEIIPDICIHIEKVRSATARSTEICGPGSNFSCMDTITDKPEPKTVKNRIFSSIFPLLIPALVQIAYKNLIVIQARKTSQKIPDRHHMPIGDFSSQYSHFPIYDSSLSEKLVSFMLEQICQTHIKPSYAGRSGCAAVHKKQRAIRIIFSGQSSIDCVDRLLRNLTCID